MTCMCTLFSRVFIFFPLQASDAKTLNNAFDRASERAARAQRDRRRGEITMEQMTEELSGYREELAALRERLAADPSDEDLAQRETDLLEAIALTEDLVGKPAHEDARA